MSRPTVVVLTAGVSQPSSTRLLGDRLGAAVARVLDERGDAPEVRVVELREHARDLTNHLLTGFAPGSLAELIEQVQDADALVAVTPIFSASYSGLFKLFFDVLPPESLVGKPVLIAVTAGTVRHALALEHALRPLFAYLRAVVVPTAVFAATEDWANGSALDERIDRAAGELADLLRPGSAGARTGEADVVPFARLLARGRA
jgi:FMN reductase